MYKVLIVDDELVIRQGLTALVESFALDYRVVDTAGNAMEANRKYQLHKPDVMIIDIRMPGQSGLELIEELRAHDPALHMIILSGYADFGYAKTAITFGIDHYLLKPVDEEELRECLCTILAKLDARKQQNKKQAALQGWSREMLVQSLLMEDGEPVLSSPGFLQEAGLVWERYQVLLIQLFHKDQMEIGYSTAVKTLLAASFEEQGWGIVFSLNAHLGAVVPPSVQHEYLRKRLVQHIRDTVDGGGYQCVITAGDVVDSSAELPVSYQSALTRMKDHFFYADSDIIGPDSLKHKPDHAVVGDEAEAKLAAVVDRLYFAVDIGNHEVFPRLIQEAGDLMIGARYSELAIKSRYVRIVTFLHNKLTLQDKEAEARHSRINEQIQYIFRHTSLQEMQRYITSLLEQFNTLVIRDETDVIMKRMIDLIKRRYAENLKLETLADVFSYSSAYLGKLFKNHTGLSFNSYLEKVRMEKAMELLDQGYKVHQAANEVGFTDVDYFREKFKKVAGVSPSDYRKTK